MVEELSEGEDAEEGSEEHDGKVECCLCEGLDVGDDALVGVVDRLEEALFVGQVSETAPSESVFVLLISQAPDDNSHCCTCEKIDEYIS